MFLDLEKGMSLDLAKDEVGFKSIDVGVNWGKINKKFLGIFGTQKDVDLDLSAILYDKNHKVINVVYYRKLRAEGIRHSGDDLVGDSIKDAKDNENISIDFTKLNPAVAKIGIVLVSFRGQPFDDVPYAQIRIYDKSHGKKEPFMQTDIKGEEKFNKRVSLIFGVLSKENNIWSYKNISEPTEKSKLEELYKEVAKHL
jgi:tellurium resistance protein TerZ